RRNGRKQQGDDQQSDRAPPPHLRTSWPHVPHTLRCSGRLFPPPPSPALRSARRVRDVELLASACRETETAKPDQASGHVSGSDVNTGNGLDLAVIAPVDLDRLVA